MRERKFDTYARVIQKAYRKYHARKTYYKLREEGNSRNNVTSKLMTDYTAKFSSSPKFVGFRINR